MNAKQKAEDLLHKYMILEDNENNFNYDIKCAIVAVDEIINTSPMYCTDSEYESNLEYWIEVKKELEEKIEL